MIAMLCLPDRCIGYRMNRCSPSRDPYESDAYFFGAVKCTQ